MTALPSGTVTFLFTDIQDSTRLWEQYPTAMAQVLARHDAIIETLAQQCDGCVVRPRGEGDSRFVVFARAHDALAATASIQQALYAENWPEQIALHVRMALHTGEGEYREGDYYGSAVNRCARLRGLAHGGQTLLSQSTYEIIQDKLPEGLRLLDLGLHRLKGLARPEHIYQLAGPGLPTEFPPLGTFGAPDKTAVQLPTFLLEDTKESRKPVFVARERELERLERFLKEALAGSGQVVFISGGAGRGKTALIDEFCRRAHESHTDLIVARGACNAHTGGGDPYLPFRDVFGMLTGDLQGAWAAGSVTHQQAEVLWSVMPRAVDAILERGTALVDVLVPGEVVYQRLKEALPFETGRLNRLRSVIDRGVSGAHELGQSLLFEQAASVIQVLARHQPCLLVFDDLQWADRASLDLLFHLGRRIGSYPILLLGAYRPEEVALRAGDRRHPLEHMANELKRVHGDIFVDLGGETESEGRRFVECLIDSEPNDLDAGFRQALMEHTEGHALFTVELLRTMQERGDLQRDEQGRWVVARGLAWDSLPARVEAVIEERIGRLEGELKDLLSVASVEGEDFTAQVVAHVQEIKERKLLRELSQELEKRHRLVREQGHVEIDGHLLSRYRFAHQLYQRYLYNNLGAGERRLLHREIAEVLEGIFADHADDHAVQLALHYSRAGIRGKALHYLTRAGHQARAKYANVEAIRYYTEALALAPEDPPQRLDLLLSRASVYHLTGRHDGQGADVKEALALAEALGDDGLCCDALIAQADHLLDTEFTHANAPAERALEIASRLEDKIRQANALRRIGFWSWHRDELHASKAALESAFQLFEEGGLLAKAASCLHLLSLTQSALDQHAAALEAAEKSVALSREAGDARQEATGLRRLAIVHMAEQRYTKALPLTQQALALHRALGDRSEEIKALNVLGIIWARLWDQAAAERYLRQSLELAQTDGASFDIRAATDNLREFVYYPRGEFEAWLAFLDSLTGAVRDLGDTLLLGYLQLWELTALRDFGLYRQSLDSLTALAASVGEITSPMEDVWLDVLSSALHTDLGEYASARQRLSTAREKARASGLEILEVHTQYFAASTSLGEGDRDRMQLDLAQLLASLDAIRVTKSQQDIADWLDLASRMSLALDQRQQALELSSEAVELITSVPNLLEPEVKLFTRAQTLFSVGQEEEGLECLQRAYYRVMLVAKNTQDETLRKSWIEIKRTNREIVELYRQKIANRDEET